MLSVIDMSASESPVSIVTGFVSCIEKPNVPDVDADQNEMSVMISPFVPAHVVQVGAVPVELIAPAAADAQETASRVVTDETLDVPADPGAPVCSCT
jgi:hypothetical protein